MSLGGHSEGLSSQRKFRPFPSKTLPQMFVEKEAEGGLRYRRSSSSSPPLVTSTPSVKLGYSGQQFHTPDKGRSQAVNIDSGYGGLDTTRKKFISNPNGSYISTPLADLTELVTSPVRELRRRWRGRPSFLEPSHTRLGGGARRMVRQVEPQQVLVWLMVGVVLTSLGFTLLVSLRQDRGTIINSRYIQSGNGKLPPSQHNEGKIVESTMDEGGITLGGKKAAIQFVFDKLAESGSLDQEDVPFEQVREFYEDFDDSIMKENNNLNKQKQGPDPLESRSETEDPDRSIFSPDEDAKMEIKSKLKSFRPSSSIPAPLPQPRAGKVLSKVEDPSSDLQLEFKTKDASLDAVLEKKDDRTDAELESLAPLAVVADAPSPAVAKLDLGDISASSVAEENAEKGDVLPNVAEQRTELENSPSTQQRGENPVAAGPRPTKRRRTKFRNPLLKISHKNKLSSAKKSPKKVLLKDQLLSSEDANGVRPMNLKENEDMVVEVEEGSIEESERKNSPVMNFPDPDGSSFR